MIARVPPYATGDANKGWVNLATFVWTNSPQQRKVAATLGNETVTVVAMGVGEIQTITGG